MGRMRSSANIDAPPIGRLSQKIQRHVTLVVKTPPSNGPAMEATPKTAPIAPKYFALRSSGRRSTKTMFEPVVMPALPIPEMARPTMKALEVGAAAQMIDPIKNIAVDAMKVHLAGKKVFQRGHITSPILWKIWKRDLHRSCP